MKKRFTFLTAALMLLVFMMPSLAGWGQTRAEGDELAVCQGTGSGYGTRRTLTDSHNVGWVLASGQSGYLGANNASSHNNVKPTAADLPVVKAVKSDATTSTTGYYFYYTTTAVANVGSLDFSYTGNSGNTNATAYVVVGDALSDSGGDAYEIITLASNSSTAQGASLGSSGTFTYTFSETQISPRFYGFIIVTSSYKRLTAGTIKLKEGAIATVSYTVTLGDDNTTLTEANPGAGVTLPSRDGIGEYTFAGWNTTNITEETTTAPAIIPAGLYHPTADVTLYPVYSRSESGGTSWTKVVSSSVAGHPSGITEGVYALLTGSDKAFNGSISSGHGQSTTSAFVFTDDVATSAPSGTCEITMVPVMNGETILGYKMYNADYGYLYASAASSGKLAWHNSESSYWSYSNYDWCYNANTAHLRVYNDSFRTYGNASGTQIKVARKGTVSTTYYISVVSITYTVTYDGNGNTSGSVPTDATAYSAGATVTVLGNTGNLAKTGYTFGGWNTRADGDGTNYSAESTFTISENTTLYAKWNAKTITGLSYSGNPTQTTYSAGDSFNTTGLTVTATFNDESSEDVTALVTWTPDPLTAGTTSVTGTYMGQTINVGGLTVTAASGSAENPYTVAQARAAIDAGTGITGVYATGIVSEIVTPYNSQYGNISYNISTDGLATSDQLQAFRGKSYNGENFTSADDIQVGDIVVVHGDLQNYQGIYEFTAGNQLVSLIRKPSITATPSPYTAPSYVVGTADPTYNVLTVNGSNLTEDISLTLNENSNFEMSTDLDSWTNSLTLTQSLGSVTDEQVAIRLKAGLAKDNYEGTVTLSSTGADNVVVNLSGTVTGLTYILAQHTAPATAHGTITFDPESPVEDGTTVTLTATPAEGYDFTADSWVIYKQSGEDYVVDNSITVTANKFDMPQYAIWVDGTFTAKPTYAIACVASPVAGGEIEASPASAYEGQTVTLSYLAETGYILSSIAITRSSDGTSTGITPAASGDDFTFTMPGYAVMVTATFEEIVDYATLPFEWDDTSTPTGITNSGVGTYDNSPHLKFDGTGDYIILKINEAPGTLTFDIKGNTFSGGTFKVQTSTDGVNYTDLKSYTSLGSTQSESFDDLESTVRYIKWVYTNKNTGNVALGNIQLLKALEKVVTPAFSLEAGTYTSAQNVTISCETADATIYYTTDGSNPTTGSTEYTTAISVDVTKTIKAIAVKEGMANSAIATAEYVITIPSIAVSSNSVEADAAETEGTITVTYNYIANVDSEVLFYEADGETEADYSSWLNADIDSDNNIYYLINNNNGSARTGYMKVHEKNTDVYSELITINQATLMITGAISFGSASGSTNINSASVTGDDAMGYTWTITTVGTTSFTPNSAYAQVGSKNNPATSITFTTTLPESVSIADFKAKFGGFSETAGTITLKVGETTVGTGSLNGTDDVTVVNSSMEKGTTLTVTVTDISRGVKCYFIDYTILSYDIYGSTEITNFTIPKGETLTIYDGAVLTITNELINEGNATNLIIEDGGQLITTSSGVNATVKKNVTAANHWGNRDNVDGWYFIASPVDGADYSTAITTGDDNDYDLFMLDWANKKWLNKKVAANSLVFGDGFTRGTGYLYASEAGNTLSVAGEILPLSNSDNATVTLANDGWNLIGNPLTCKVTANCAFCELNGGSAVNNGTANSSIINPYQGIAVYGAAGDVVSFTKAEVQNAAAPGNNSSLNVTLAKKVTSRGETSSKVVDNAVVSFSESRGLPKFSMLGNGAKLYIPQDDEEYAVAFSNKQGDVSLNFHANEVGSYTINFAGEGTDLKGMYLIDMLDEQEIDLSVEPSYTFIGSPADRAARFKIVFRTGFENSPNDIFAYQNGSDIVVCGEGELQIFDVMGRMVATQRISGVETINVKSQGVYIFRLNDKTQKIVVR